MKFSIFWIAVGTALMAMSCQNETISPVSTDPISQQEVQNGEVDSSSVLGYRYVLLQELPMVIQQSFVRQFPQAIFLRGEREDSLTWEITYQWRNQIWEAEFTQVGRLTKSKVLRNYRFDRPMVPQITGLLSAQFLSYQVIFVETDQRGNQEVVIRANQEEWEAEWSISTQRVSLKKIKKETVWRDLNLGQSSDTTERPFHYLLKTELPRSVQSTLDRLYPQAQFVKATSENSKTWEALILDGATYWELTFSSTGELIEQELELEDRYDLSLPSHVMSILQNRFPTFLLVFTETDQKGNQEAVIRWNREEWKIDWEPIYNDLEIQRLKKK